MVSKLWTDVHAALGTPEVKEKLANLGNDTLDMTQQEFSRFVHDEMETYARLIARAGIQPQ